ncbi:UNVERIFIED_CONTAM: YLP motif-containing protein 1 [Sesamum radiatum]|uniref:YLP motif-containing protein 1 n=1 Tax=Sesamum radiatum TaxID=300843 RepID=A0AAW2WFQ9_SESRA
MASQTSSWHFLPCLLKCSLPILSSPSSAILEASTTSGSILPHSPPPSQPPPPLPPPPSLPPQPSYDPFVDHQAGPAINPYQPPPSAQIPHPPWNGNPNFSKDYYGDSSHGLNYDSNGQIGVKRMRVDTLAEDERRLKLIRDHGAASHCVDRSYGGGYRFLNNSYEASNIVDKRANFGDRFQCIDGGYHQEINSHIKQNYGECQFASQHIENNSNVELGRSAYNHSESNLVQNQGYGNGVHADGYRKLEQPGGNHETLAYENSHYQQQRRNFTTESLEFSQSHGTQHHIIEHKSVPYGLPHPSENMHAVRDSQGFKGQPPLPTSPPPPPPLPVEPPRFRFSESVVSSSASGPSSLFPIAVDSAPSFQSPYTKVSQAITSGSTHYSSKENSDSSGYYPGEIQAVKVAAAKTFNGESEEFPPRHLSDKPKDTVEYLALKSIMQKGRSGKSYLAKILRDLEVENGGTAPRIHSMDEYFMTEVEKVEQSDGSRSSGSVRGKRPVMKKVMEYCYEPEMEEIMLLNAKDVRCYVLSIIAKKQPAYRSSMLKAFKKTLDEGAFPFVIVDDRNLRVADFAQFWATAKGCAARNVHGFTQTDIDKMANQWEEAPALYLKLDVKSLLHGDDLEENGIQERSNPLPEEEKLTQRSGESRRRSVFQEQLRAEREAFKAAFDKRRHRISGLDVDDE